MQQRAIAVQTKIFHRLQSAAAAPITHIKTTEQIANVDLQHTKPRHMGSPVEGSRALSDMKAYSKLKMGVPMKGE